MEIYLNLKTIFLASIALAVLYVGYTVISAFFAMINNYIFVVSG